MGDVAMADVLPLWLADLALFGRAYWLMEMCVRMM